MSSDDAVLLTPEEAAKLLRVSSRTVRRWIAEGRLNAVILSDRRRLVPRVDVLRLAGIEKGAELERLERLAERLERTARRLEEVAERLDPAP